MGVFQFGKALDLRASAANVAEISTAIQALNPPN
jgi:hypothetical protein